MTECIGIVFGCDGSHWARVLTHRKDACAGLGVVVAFGRSDYATRRLTPVIEAVVRRGSDGSPCPQCRR